MDILDFCRANSAQISEDIKDEYFPNGDYESKKDAFFDRLKNLEQPIIFPFDSEFLLQKANYKKVVQILPEFLASIFQLGFDKVTTFMEYKDQIDKNNILVSAKNLRSVSEVLWESHKLLHNLILSGYTDHELKSKILSNLKLLNFRKPHYDIIGCFQTIHTSFALMLDIPGDSPTRELAFYIPKSHKKGNLLHRLVGEHSIPLRVLQQRKGTDSVDRHSLRIEIIEEYAKIHNLMLPQSYEVKTMPLDRVKEITHQYPKKIDGLVLILPEDQTTDQSPVCLEFMSNGKKVSRVGLSHMEGAFIYYLGSERQAGETYWLHAPQEHLKLLEVISKSFSLPKTFEKELKITKPLKDATSTWIWDFKNLTRKNIRSKIIGKIKILRNDLLEFNLITRLKPITAARKGNYQLSTNIEFFRVKKPSR